jgi:hypothetical protein
MIPTGPSHQSRAGIKGTRRNPSAFKYDPFDLPSSTAPRRIEPSEISMVPEHSDPDYEPSMLPMAQELIDLSLIEIANGRPPVILSTTQLAMARGAGGDDDTYIPGTARERTYMRSKTTVKDTDFDDRDLDEGVSSIDLDQMPPASTAPARSTTATYTELSTGQFVEVSDRVFEWE